MKRLLGAVMGIAIAAMIAGAGCGKKPESTSTSAVTVESVKP
jgi:hypothetical protein